MPPQQANVNAADWLRIDSRDTSSSPSLNPGPAHLILDVDLQGYCVCWRSNAGRLSIFRAATSDKRMAHSSAMPQQGKCPIKINGRKIVLVSTSRETRDDTCKSLSATALGRSGCAMVST